MTTINTKFPPSSFVLTIPPHRLTMEKKRSEQTAASPSKEKGEHNTVTELGSTDTVRIQLCCSGERPPPPSPPSHAVSLSSGQMESLCALCDTFLPSISVSNHDTIDDSVSTFFRTSASLAGTPHKVGELITERMKHPKLVLVRLVLWALSTWIGTFILCGGASLGSGFPYFQRFSKVSPQKREEIVKSWSDSYFRLLRMLFVALKFLTLLTFFTQVNDNNENLSWKAIGYSGPDLDANSKTAKNRISKDQMRYPRLENQAKQDEDDIEELFGPLYRGIINLNSPLQIVAETFQKSGFRVSFPSQINPKQDSLNPALIIKCDAVVVGSGSGGGVVAGVLAKAGHKVLVLEKGNYCARTNLSLLEGDALEKMYMGSGLIATEDMGVIILAAATVGGGSTVNWSASIQTPKHVIEEWCENYELELFESRMYKEAMDVVCEKMGVQFDVENEGFNNAVLRRGCEELGYPVMNIPRNSPMDHYCGWCCFGCKDGRKKGTSETWLVDVVNSGNGAIISGCEALQVLHKRKKGRDRSTATGVAFEFQREGFKQIYIVQSKVTVVACGALATPSLLKRSGLKNPNIGKNLHLHPVTLAWGYFPDPSPNLWLTPEKKSYQGGIMTAMSTVVANPDKSGYGAMIQTPSLHPGMFSVLTPWVSGIDIKMRMCKFSRTAHVFALARDQGSGEVISESEIRYQMAETDEANLQRGLEKALRIMAAAGAEEIGTNHQSGKKINVKRAGWQEFERFVKEESGRRLRGEIMTPICSAHQMGSCRMGIEPNGSAVNQMGETWEVECLYVADSSVFPTALGVNPMVTVQAIAYCTAQSVLGALRRKKNG